MGHEDKSDMMTLKARVAQALHAEREKDGGCTTRLSTLRLIDAAIRDRDVCARGRGDSEGCPDADVRNVLEIMIAQRDGHALPDGVWIAMNGCIWDPKKVRKNRNKNRFEEI